MPSTNSPVPYTRFSTQLTGSISQISKMIEDNAKMIDMIQEVALQLTTAINTLYNLTLQYAGIANGILDVLLPILRNLPLVPKNVMDMLVNLEKLTQQIIDSKAETTRTLSDVQSGLTTGDVKKLQTHADDLQALTKTLTGILPK